MVSRPAKRTSTLKKKEGHPLRVSHGYCKIKHNCKIQEIKFEKDSYENF